MNETKINAMFQSLMNQNQGLVGQLAEAHGIIAELQEAHKAATEVVEDEKSKGKSGK